MIIHVETLLRDIIEPEAYERIMCILSAVVDNDDREHTLLIIHASGSNGLSTLQSWLQNVGGKRATMRSVTACETKLVLLDEYEEVKYSDKLEEILQNKSIFAIHLRCTSVDPKLWRYIHYYMAKTRFTSHPTGPNDKLAIQIDENPEFIAAFRDILLHWNDKFHNEYNCVLPASVIDRETAVFRRNLGK